MITSGGTERWCSTKRERISGREDVSSADREGIIRSNVRTVRRERADGERRGNARGRIKSGSYRLHGNMALQSSAERKEQKQAGTEEVDQGEDAGIVGESDMTALSVPSGDRLCHL